ncbi:hypothetical protein OT109_19445 [Phycisphaeraceae bacterium D3-23]
MSKTHPDIVILGYSEAAMLLKQKTEINLVGLVSISGQRDPQLVAAILPRLDLSFDDTPVIDDTDAVGQYRLREQRRKAAEIGLNLQPPTAQDARAIIEFIEPMSDPTGTLMFQCFAGISRSAGAALLALAQWHGPGEEEQSVRDLFVARPAAQPHTGLIRYGDLALGRGGRLIEALAAEQRRRM